MNITVSISILIKVPPAHPLVQSVAGQPAQTLQSCPFQTQPGRVLRMKQRKLQMYKLHYRQDHGMCIILYQVCVSRDYRGAQWT